MRVRNIELINLINERWLTRVSHLLAIGKGILVSYEKGMIKLNALAHLLISRCLCTMSLQRS